MAVSRRRLIGGSLALLTAPGWAGRSMAAQANATPPAGRLSFEVWRQGAKIGEHSVTVHADGDGLTATLDARFVVKLGPVPVFHYRHEGTERWADGRFVDVRTRTVTNGRVEQMSATRTPAGVDILTAKGARLTAPADCAPLSHWNAAALHGPLFHPQTGAVLREQVAARRADTVKLASGAAIPAARYALTGDALITDWYDDSGAWAALHARVSDGSLLDYRRMA